MRAAGEAAAAPPSTLFILGACVLGTLFLVPVTAAAVASVERAGIPAGAAPDASGPADPRRYRAWEVAASVAVCGIPLALAAGQFGYRGTGLIAPFLGPEGMVVAGTLAGGAALLITILLTTRFQLKVRGWRWLVTAGAVTASNGVAAAGLIWFLLWATT